MSLSTTRYISVTYVSRGISSSKVSQLRESAAASSSGVLCRRSFLRPPDDSRDFCMVAESSVKLRGIAVGLSLV